VDAEKTQQSLQDLHAGAGRILGADYEALERLNPESAAAILRGRSACAPTRPSWPSRGRSFTAPAPGRGAPPERAGARAVPGAGPDRPDDDEARATIRRLEESLG
jgi:hypothetical protein